MNLHGMYRWFGVVPQGCGLSFRSSFLVIFGALSCDFPGGVLRVISCGIIVGCHVWGPCASLASDFAPTTSLNRSWFGGFSSCSSSWPRGVRTPPEIISYYRLNYSIWSLSDNKETSHWLLPGLHPVNHLKTQRGSNECIKLPRRRVQSALHINTNIPVGSNYYKPLFRT
jgi:hypothetical protein